MIYTFLTGYWLLIIVAVLIVVIGALAFRANFARYSRVSGYAFQISLLRTIAFLLIIAGTAAVAWLVACLILSQGILRNVVAVVLFSILSGAVGTPLMGLVTRIIEVKHYL